MIQKKLPRSFSRVEDLVSFSEINLIVADLDGTLIGSDASIGNRILPLRRSVQQYSVKFTIATGRTLNGVAEMIKELKISRDVPIILYNGSLVLKNGNFQILMKKTIPIEALKQILKFTEKKSVNVLAYFFDPPSSKKLKSSSPLDFEYVLGWSNNISPKKDFNGMDIKWLNWGFCPINSSPSAILIDIINDVKSADLLSNSINEIPGVTVTRSGSQFLEIRPENSNKGKATEDLCHFLGLRREEILAIGDNDNDAELLEWAGIGIAVKNSSEKALEKSDYICEYDSQGGAIQALRLIKEAKYFYSAKNKKSILRCSE